jgi:hypothetical protein
MSGGKQMAECISGNLGIPCLGREILIHAAAKLGVPEKVLASNWDQPNVAAPGKGRRQHVGLRAPVVCRDKENGKTILEKEKTEWIS